MNKQALAFLTLFSLILMLSVYYVTLPMDTASVMGENTNAEESQADNPSQRTSLQEEAGKKKDDEITKNSNTVSSPDASDADKQKALETIDELKNDKAMQEDVAALLNDNGYMAAVEIMDGTCIITVFEQEDSAQTAKKIMNLAQSKVQQQYLVEVAFK